MNIKIENAKEEFDNKNHEKVLEILSGVEADDEHYKLVLMMKSASLMRLGRYSEALTVINSGIEKYPYDEFLWSRKVEAYYFGGDKDEALKALGELERIANKDDKNALVNLAVKFELLKCNEKALKYCDMALAIDENFVDAISQKATIAGTLGDYDMMNDCANRLLEIYDEDILKLMLPLMLKLFCGRYRDCIEIINSVVAVDDEYKQMLKTGVYNRMSEDLNIELLTSSPVEITVEDALGLFFDYYYCDIENGEINGAHYFIRHTD